MNITLSDITAGFAAAIDGINGTVAEAATIAIRVGGINMKNQSRANIRAAGFSIKWENAYRLKLFPKSGKPSIDAAAFARLNIKYGEIFEKGGIIRGKNLLWLPLRDAPVFDKRGAHKSPRDLAQAGIKLFTINVPGKRPLLATDVRMSRSLAAKSRVKVTFADLKRSAKGRKAAEGAGVLRAVPLFFGIDAVSIRKRLNLKRIEDQAQARIPSLYHNAVQRLKDK